jgi:hypothetical protein
MQVAESQGVVDRHGTFFFFFFFFFFFSPAVCAPLGWVPHPGRPGSRGQTAMSLAVGRGLYP